MSNTLDSLNNIISVFGQYVKAAINTIMGNSWLMILSILAVLMIGKSVKVGKAFSYTSK